MLYDEQNILNPEKVNTHIYKALLGEDIIVAEKLSNYINQQNLVDMMLFDRVEFSKSISLAIKKKAEIESKWDIKPLNTICNIKIGGTPSRQRPEYYQNGTHLWVSISEMNGATIIDTKEKINELGIKNSNVKPIKKGTTLLSFKLSIGKTAIAGKDLYTNEAIAGLEVEDQYKNEITNGYLFYLFSNNIIDLQKSDNKAFGKSLNSEDLKNIRIPIPPKNVQEQIIEEIEGIEVKEKAELEKLEKLNAQIDSILNSISGSKVSLKSIIEINPSKANATSLSENTPVSFVEMASVSNEGYITNIAIKELKEVKQGYTYFQNGDVLFAKITPCMENGKGALVSGLETGIGFGSTEFFVLRVSNKILNQLLYLILKQKSFRLEAEKNMAGASGHRRVPRSFIESYEIPLPAIDEQKNIVAEIEQIENQIIELKKQLENIPQEKAAILHKYLS